MPAFFWLWCALVFTAAPSAVRAQWPGEIRGQVADEASGRPLASADVYLLPNGTRTVTSASGTFRFRSLQPGEYTVHVGALGYLPTSLDVSVANGSVVDVRLSPARAPLPIEGVVASLAAADRGGITLDVADLRSRVGSTVADALTTVPGVLIVETAAGGAQSPTIRGSASDAVLVLVDGVPLNDPITGQADLSTIPISGVSSVTVLPGGQSARFGPRAQAGVILIRSGQSSRRPSAEFVTGTLGEYSGSADVSHDFIGGRVDAHGAHRRRDGAFDFTLPPEVGGGASRVTNTDAQVTSGRLNWSEGVGGTRTSLGVAAERVSRGLPGRSFAPSRTAHQALTQVRLFGSTTRPIGTTGAGTLSAYLRRSGTDFWDPDPPFGQPFDDETSLRSAGLDFALTREVPLGLISLGGTGKRLRVESTVLSGGPLSRTDTGAWLSASSPPAPLAITGSVRLDRGGLPAAYFPSHDLGVRGSVGPASIRLGHRSSYSPPTLGDQFFREGVGVEPNPDLAAERVPSEWIAGLAVETVRGVIDLSLDAEVYRGDVQGMIVWLPDFRFVWSPRNQDVRRRGVDVRAEIAHPLKGLRFWGSWSLNRTTYNRADLTSVQVAYRPRYAGAMGVSANRGGWSVVAAARYTGARFPVPNAVNELPSFWTTTLSARRDWQIGGTPLEFGIEADRLFNEKDALIFAFPHPGRTLRLRVRVGADN